MGVNNTMIHTNPTETRQIMRIAFWIIVAIIALLIAGYGEPAFVYNPTDTFDSQTRGEDEEYTPDEIELVNT